MLYLGPLCLALMIAVARPAHAQAIQTNGKEITPVAASQERGAREPSGAGAFMRDVLRDYRNFLSIDNAQWAAVGSVVTLIVHQVDDNLSPPTPTTSAKVGNTYGNLAFQFPLAIGWWAIGHGVHSSRGADAGRDLVRAQISAVSWTYLVKYSVNRTRPNGDPRSFPSGHASATFATASVLEQHYGWKLGLPVFGAATYTAVERVRADKHWASDVVAGALVGVLAGRTVTIRLRQQKVAIGAEAVPGGAGVTVHVFD
jgi:membrane-associated phospholipid phosphatase